MQSRTRGLLVLGTLMVVAGEVSQGEQLFKLGMDDNADGKVTLKEMENWFQRNGDDPSEAKGLFKQMDSNRDGKVTAREATNLLSKVDENGNPRPGFEHEAADEDEDEDDLDANPPPTPPPPATKKKRTTERTVKAKGGDDVKSKQSTKQASNKRTQRVSIDASGVSATAEPNYVKIPGAGDEEWDL